MANISTTVVPEAGSPEGEAEGEPEPSAETEPEPEAEVGPDWDTAYAIWGSTWPLHVYLFCMVFLIIVLISSFLLMVLLCYNSRNIYVKRTATIFVMLMIFGITRGLRLAVDPYSAQKRIHVLVSRLMWSCGFPCLTVSYNVVLNVVKTSMKVADDMKVSTPPIKKILLMTILHFTLSGVTEIVIYFKPEAGVLLTICQGYFIMFGFYLTASYTYVGYQTRSLQDYTWMRVKIGIAAINAACLSIVHIYLITRAYTSYASSRQVDPWEWWSTQTLLRIIEITACAVILLIVLGTPGGDDILRSIRNGVRRHSSRKISATEEFEITKIDRHSSSEKKSLNNSTGQKQDIHPD